MAHLRFTGAGTTVVHASTKENGLSPVAFTETLNVADVIRYLSLHENKYIRYFTGHKSRFASSRGPSRPYPPRTRVTSIDISPSEDSFLSSSLDGTARLWDARSANCQGVLHCGEGQSLATYDPKGVVFAIGSNPSTVSLYDARNHDKVRLSSHKSPPHFSQGPFASIATDRTAWSGASPGVLFPSPHWRRHQVFTRWQASCNLECRWHRLVVRLVRVH